MSQENQIPQDQNKEGVHYIMPTKAVRSRIGLAVFFALVSLWGLSFIWSDLINEIMKLLFSVNGDDWKQKLVFAISLSVPLSGMFIFTNKRIFKLLAENPENSNDLFYKKSIRSSIIFISIYFLFAIGSQLYNILSIMFLDKMGNLTIGIIDLLTASLFCSVIFFYSWYFQKKSDH